MKNVSFIWKNQNGLFGQPNTLYYLALDRDLGNWFHLGILLQNSEI